MKTLDCFWSLLFAFFFSLSACSSGDDESPNSEVSYSDIEIDSTIITNGLNFTSESGEKSISFSAKDNWTLNIASTTSGATWCTASATSGSKGNASVKFFVTENTSYDDRSVSTTIKSGTVSKTFSISQKCIDALLVTNNKYEVGQEGSTINIEVKANIDYKIEVSEKAKEWITESSGRALTNYKHTFNVAMNEELEKREGEIYFKSDDKVETIKVYQSGGAIILLSQNEYNVSDKGDTISVDIRSNIEYEVKMPNVNWIINEASSRGLSSHTLKYIIAANEQYKERSANIIFYDKNSGVEEVLKIVQERKEPEGNEIEGMPNEEW